MLLIVAFIIGVAVLKATEGGGGGGTAQSVRSSGARTTTTVRSSRATTTVPVVTTTPARPVGQVKVLPLNGSGISGVAAKVADQLKALGYANTLAPDTYKSDEPVSATIIEYATGSEADARAVAQGLRVPNATLKPIESPPPVADIRGAEVIVIAGSDLAAALNGNGATTTTSG
jgi:hypothetical protein